MGGVLVLLGLATLLWARRRRSQRAEWVLSGVVLLGVGITQIADLRNAPRNPDFAQPRRHSATSGTALGGGISYREFGWLEENAKRYIAGKIKNQYDRDWERVRIIFEVFDATGNSLGTLYQEIRRIKPGEELGFKLEVPYPSANRFTLVRFSF